MTDPTTGDLELTVRDLADFADHVRAVRRALDDMRDAGADLAAAAKAGDRRDVLAALATSRQARDTMLAELAAAFPEAWEAAGRHLPPDGAT